MGFKKWCFSESVDGAEDNECPVGGTSWRKPFYQ
jgi:hypothetical protein